jgi:2-polyprenyl-3-methyl-5-hydroxy-6-metoxy-1,4-benzoquinol methylase
MTFNPVKSFYDINQFPGHYTLEGLQYHIPKTQNPYLELIENYITSDVKTVIDVGCGTGVIANLFAMKNPTVNFTACDFADSIAFAEKFATEHNISNIKYQQVDFLEFGSTHDTQYDLVICQGVLHHIPEYETAIKYLTKLIKPGGTLILGVYNPYGKILKKFFKINYLNDILYKDQELNPFETSFTVQQIKNYFNGLTLVDAYPSQSNVRALFNSKNGGLITYIFKFGKINT